ncbi:hypothetical protein ZWY2020_048105 [Hordeum vulgare]|nr:hypothetical protein ZWY2020_048105 [Hordeum vulgare]
MLAFCTHTLSFFLFNPQYIAYFGTRRPQDTVLILRPSPRHGRHRRRGRAAGPLRSAALASFRSRSLLHLLTPARAISSAHGYHPSAAVVVPSQGHPHPPSQQWGPTPPQWSPQGHPPPPPANNYYHYQ